MLNNNRITYLKYISNNEKLLLVDLCQKHDKTSSFIRKELEEINKHLEDKISIINSEIITSFDYQHFLNFMSNLKSDDYQLNIEERTEYIILYSYFSDIINLTKLYDEWNLSLTTKKTDTKYLESVLEKYKLEIERIPSKGIRIVGDILQYRILIIMILSKTIDLDNDNINPRKANTPIENSMYEVFYQNSIDKLNQSMEIVNNYLDEYEISINYYSRKFIILYVILVLGKQKESSPTISNLLLKPHNFYMFKDRVENYYFNKVVSLIDTVPRFPNPHNEELYQLIENLVDIIEEKTKIKIYTKDELTAELYNYIYRQYFINYYHYLYEDKLVKETESVLNELYTLIDNNMNKISSYLKTNFNHEQISSITLITNKWLLRNNIYDDQNLKVVLVTNIASERVEYFIESLSNYISFTHVTTIDINEINKLNKIEFDYIFCFSKRTSTTLKLEGYDAITINYFLDYQNIEKLLKLGFPIASKKILATSLVNDINKLNNNELLNHLKSKYNNIFI